MVAIHQRRNLRLIGLRIPFQAADPVFQRAAKSGTDLKTFIGSAIGDHGSLLITWMPEPQTNYERVSSFFYLCRS
jgi:hypothetical protein